MAFEVGKGGVQSEINVTPLVDVVLVLLIIFMVITPLLTKSLPVLVPEKAEEEAPPEQVNQQLVVYVNEDNSIDLNGTPTTIPELVEKLPGLLKRVPQKVVFFDADDGAPYGTCVNVMDAARGAGAATLGIMTPDLLGDSGASAPPPAVP
ncbi:biopolymer transporter ExbD [Myxococcota bacterium]|nr:biopolymer transporter ExbD [Myxococcota bacterium]